LLHKTMNPRRCDITGFLPCFCIMSSSSYVVCVCVFVSLCVGFFLVLRWCVGDQFFLVLWGFDFDRGCVLLELFI
jgi:hypothetical protein